MEVVNTGLPNSLATSLIILLTSGASTPDNLVEAVVHRLVAFTGGTVAR